MDAIYSGQAGAIALIEGAEARVRRIDHSDEVSIAREGVSYLFQGCTDLTVVKGAREEQIKTSFEDAWEADRALRLFLISLDPEEERGLRGEAADCLEELLPKPSNRLSIENEFYSRVLPNDADTDFLASKKWPLASEIITRIIRDQKSIADCRRDWDNLPITLFKDEDKLGFEEPAIRRGAFRILGSIDTEHVDANIAILNCYRVLADVPNSRSVVNEWSARLKRPSLRPIVLQEEPEETTEAGEIPLVDPRVAFERSRAQREAIAEKLKAGSLVLARRYTDQLVESQLRKGGTEFAAKSLCDLAQYAKYYHLHSLQLEWAQRAVEICPSDAWAHGQAADALIQFFRLDEALHEFALCETYGDPQFAATGRARILRHQGRLDEALAAFRAARERFKGGEGKPFAWSGAAETLRDMWKFEEALEEYKLGLAEFPHVSFLRCGWAAVLADLGQLDQAFAAYDVPELRDNLVALNGKASVLRDQGKLDEALRTIEQIIENYTSDPIARCLQAEILRDKGDVQGAMQVYEFVKTQYPTISVAYSGFAEVLRDMRRLPEAITAYEHATRRFPMDSRLANGFANIRKVNDELSEALRLYEKNVRQFPYDLWSKSGRADLLKRLGRYDDAINAYDEILRLWPNYESARNGKAAVLVIIAKYTEALSLLPSGTPRTKDDWIAWHIRGMVFLRTNKIDEAVQFFEDGGRSVPFARERKYFDGALSLARLRQGKFEQAAQALIDTGGGVSNVLRLHAYAGSGDIERARSLYGELKERCPVRLTDLRDAIAARFGMVPNLPAHNDHWIFGRETEALLQEAA